MAHSADKEPETGTGITPYWPKNKINPPVDWEDWIDQFFLASDLKEKCQTRSLLNPPDAVVEEPLPQPEVPRAHESTEQESARILRDDANRRKVEALNNEARKKGPRLAHNVFYHELENTIRAKLYLWLGTEGTRKLKLKSPNLKLQETTFRDFHKLCVETFKLEKNNAYERFKLFTREQKGSGKAFGFLWGSR